MSESHISSPIIDRPGDKEPFPSTSFGDEFDPFDLDIRVSTQERVFEPMLGNTLSCNYTGCCPISYSNCPSCGATNCGSCPVSHCGTCENNTCYTCTSCYTCHHPGC